MRICLDAGHYGKYNQSPCNKAYYESDMVWKLHLLQKKYLEEYGVEVILTRTSQACDRELYSRGAASAGCDLFISDHSNAAANTSVDYPVAYCAINGSADKIGLALAQCVGRVMGTKQAARIEHRSGSHGDYYGVVRGSTAVGTPGLILEHSFHTSPAATAWLLNDANLDRLARAEVEVIANYYGIAASVQPAQKYNVGWYLDAAGWWYADTPDTYLRSCWSIINGHRYYFDSEGYAVKGWQEIDGKWYYFEPRAGHPLECALYVSDADGVQDIGAF